MRKAFIIGKEIQLPNYLGYVIEGESHSETIRFEMKKYTHLRDYLYTLYYRNSKGYGNSFRLGFPTDADDKMYLDWDVTSDFTSVAGNTQIWIEGVDYNHPTKVEADFSELKPITYYVKNGDEYVEIDVSLYNETVTYPIGSYVVHAEKLYTNTQETTGTWDATKWTLTTGYYDDYPVWKTFTTTIRVATAVDFTDIQPEVPTIFPQYVAQLETIKDETDEIKEATDDIKDEVIALKIEIEDDVTGFEAQLNEHKTDYTNPHQVTAQQAHALPDTTKYGTTLEVSMNQSNYVCTFTLKDQDGNLICPVQTIDFPIESVVVSGYYDSVNKKLVLVLKDGSKIEIPVAGLISGLVTETSLAQTLSNYYNIQQVNNIRTQIESRFGGLAFSLTENGLLHIEEITNGN